MDEGEYTKRNDLPSVRFVINKTSGSNIGRRLRIVRGQVLQEGKRGAKVYLALNASTGEMIAMKQIEAKVNSKDREDTSVAISRPSPVKRFMHELDILKDLNHPHIISYIGMEINVGQHSLYMEYVQCGDLANVIRKYGKPDEANTKYFTMQILNGLEYLHSKGIAHGHLSTRKVLMDTSGICKICGFGDSKLAEGDKATFAIDILSLGSIVFELWTGRRQYHWEIVQVRLLISSVRTM
ncbi:kinase-like protein [Panus rudis PR-1116 ss-1]|nr:kinase-like protein [Panus rudis PR-1116 ss-1]